MESPPPIVPILVEEVLQDTTEKISSDQSSFDLLFLFLFKRTFSLRYLSLTHSRTHAFCTALFAAFLISLIIIIFRHRSPPLLYNFTSLLYHFLRFTLPLTSFSLVHTSSSLFSPYHLHHHLHHHHYQSMTLPNFTTHKPLLCWLTFITRSLAILHPFPPFQSQCHKVSNVFPA